MKMRNFVYLCCKAKTSHLVVTGVNYILPNLLCFLNALLTGSLHVFLSWNHVVFAFTGLNVDSNTPIRCLPSFENFKMIIFKVLK